MVKIFTFLSILLFWELSFAQTFNLGRFSIGESRINVDLDDFIINHENSLVDAQWVPASVQWIRNESNLLVPRAILKIVVKNNNSLLHLKYQNHVILPVKKNAEEVESQIYIDLFDPETVSLYKGDSLFDKINILAHGVLKTRSKQLIDYSCSPFDLKIEGIDSEYLSVGCRIYRLGKLGSETPRLEITMSSTNLRTMSKAKPPFTIYLEDSSPVEIRLQGADQEIKMLKLNAALPERLHRFKTAIGFGPYVYESKENLAIQKANLAPSFMIYGKLDLTDTASFKAFDALLYSKTFFNNSGLYFSYDLASAFDERVLINALLGFQGLHYRYTKNSPTVFRLIYPQGFEFIYKHAFIENYALTYGMFLSTSSESYLNGWIRYGKKNFLEINYIKWGYRDTQIKMIGLSLGIPFIGLF